MHSSTKQAVRDAFALAAPSYDRVGPAFFQTFGRRLVELADIRPGMSVLDVGCGAGAALLPAAEAAGPGASSASTSPPAWSNAPGRRRTSRA